MFLHRIHLNPRSREARRDLSDPYQMHSTLCRAFSSPERKCAAGEFLWRLEPEVGADGLPRLLVQGRSPANWAAVNLAGWCAKEDHSIDLRERLHLDSLSSGRRFRFRLRANPSVTRNHKRVGLLRTEEQEAWLARKGATHGFRLSSMSGAETLDGPVDRIAVGISQEQMLRGRTRDGGGILVYSVLYDGVLTVTEPAMFVLALESGIGHGKAMGLGLLSVAPAA